uniref:Pectate lyase n=1 Tax=viral metagenome TaxID=1070528 RepID=A0A6M3LAR8_9ZZZZ
MIKKRNLDPSLVQWIMTATGFGPGMGKIKYLCVDGSSTSQYEPWLWDQGVKESEIFYDLATAYAAMEAYRNDILLVLPGDHIQTAQLTWDKDATALVGCGSLNQRFQGSTYVSGGIRISCVTAAVTDILNITADYFSMYNIGTFNSAANTGNKSDINISGKNFYADHCAFRGGNNATQIANATAGIPIWVDSAIAGGGNAMWIKNSMIGSAGNTTRTKGPGCMYFEGGAAAGFNPVIENCLLSTRCEVETGSQTCMILLEANYAVDRELLFKGCNFYNFVENLANKLDVCITDECATTHTITIDQTCTLSGVDAWATPMTYVQCSAPVGYVTGGIGLNA